MNLNPIKALQNRGTHFGLSQTSNSFKMAGYIVAPFLVAFFAIKIFAPAEWSDIISGMAFVAWIAYIVLLYAKAKADAAGYMPFPQAHWTFPDGQQVSFDILVPPNGVEQLIEYADGSTLQRVMFKDKAAYQEADRDLPDVFGKALWKLPANWNDSFARNGHGEFFFENLFIDHPACENIEVSVIDWDEQGTTRIPICVITGCSYFYDLAKASEGKSFPATGRVSMDKSARQEAVIKDLKELNRELKSRCGFLESEHKQYVDEEPVDIKKFSDDRMERNRKRVGNILDTGLSWKQWILLNGKYIGYALLGIGVFVIITHFIAGWP